MIKAVALPPVAVIHKLWASFKTNKFGREVLMTTQGHCELGKPQSLELCNPGFKNDLCWSKFKQKLVGVSLTATCWQLWGLQEPSAEPEAGTPTPVAASLPIPVPRGS